jgi:hypothetical protein
MDFSASRRVLSNAGYPILKKYQELRVDRAPILPPAGPFFRNVHRGQIEHIEKSVV